jgi:tetratricopeptide (TPR) repeat protein
LFKRAQPKKVRARFVSAENSVQRDANGPRRTEILVKIRLVTLRVGVVSALVVGMFAQAAAAQETALPGLREAARQAPNDAAAQQALGRALIEAGRLPEAETAMNAGVRLAKGSVESLYELARVKFATGDYKRSRAACLALSTKDKNHVLTQVCTARALLVWRRASRAVESIDAALRIDPDNYEALLAEADAERIEGDFAAAEKAYAALIARFPRSADALIGLGLSRASANQPQQAIAALRQAAAIDAQDPDIQ